jgi:hypothetical protein
MSDTVAYDLSAKAPPAAYSPPFQAMWWLAKGRFAVGPEWKNAHHICQGFEGDRACDMVHALAHLIEGDMANAVYWYSKSGMTRQGNAEQEWHRISAQLQDHQG